MCLGTYWLLQIQISIARSTCVARLRMVLMVTPKNRSKSPLRIPGTPHGRWPRLA